VKKLAAAFLLAVLGLAAPVDVRAQNERDTANDAARMAAQKHNAKVSRKREKAQERAMRKSMGKPHRMKKRAR